MGILIVVTVVVVTEVYSSDPYLPKPSGVVGTNKQKEDQPKKAFFTSSSSSSQHTQTLQFLLYYTVDHTLFFLFSPS